MADLLIIKDVTLKGRLTECVRLKNTGAINRDIVYPELKNRADSLYYTKGKLQLKLYFPKASHRVRLSL